MLTVKIREEGLASARRDDLWGYIDMNGNWVIKAQYINVDDFIGGLAIVRDDGLWGIINEAGKFVAEPKFLKILSPKEDPIEESIN